MASGSRWSPSTGCATTRSRSDFPVRLLVYPASKASVTCSSRCSLCLWQPARTVASAAGACTVVRPISSHSSMARDCAARRPSLATASRSAAAACSEKGSTLRNHLSSRGTTHAQGPAQARGPACCCCVMLHSVGRSRPRHPRGSSSQVHLSSGEDLSSTAGRTPPSMLLRARRCAWMSTASMILRSCFHVMSCTAQQSACRLADSAECTCAYHHHHQA
mmetsp:Transcript_19756/g.51033  ORF Transcript_19756/g.51033 Transcript_19756/m.51033 type:complete len:219 (-) Transcript_19756:855-1511(-)